MRYQVTDVANSLAEAIEKVNATTLNEQYFNELPEPARTHAALEWIEEIQD